MPKKRDRDNNNKALEASVMTSSAEAALVVVASAAVVVASVASHKKKQKNLKTTTTTYLVSRKTRMRKGLKKRSRRWPSSIIQTRTWKTQRQQRKCLPRSPMPTRCSQTRKNVESMMHRVLRVSIHTNRGVAVVVEVPISVILGTLISATFLVVAVVVIKEEEEVAADIIKKRKKRRLICSRTRTYKCWT